jgi:hypothetical protein
MSDTQVRKRPPFVQLRGRSLFLTEDTSLIRRQLEGEDLSFDSNVALMSNI